MSRRKLRLGRQGRHGTPLKAVLRELRQLKEEHQALKDCLCATGLLTQAELAKHAQRLQASQFHRVLRSPALVRHLAVLVGIRSMTHFASTSSTASAACRSLLLMSQGPTHADVQGGPVPQGLFGRLFSKGAEGHGKEPDEPHDHAGEKDVAPSQEPSCQSVAVASQAQNAQMRSGLSTRLFSRLFRIWTEPSQEKPVCHVMQLKEVLRSIGQLCGATAAFQLCQTCRCASEALRQILPLISQEAPFIYVCGGSCGIAMDSAERFNPRTGQWETLPSMCMPRRACATASTGGRFYVMGGVDVPRFAGGFGEELQHWMNEDKCRPECFDPVLNSWELLPAMSRPYTHAAATSLGGYIYIFGGLSFGHVLDQAQRFDPAKGQWECLEPMPTPRFECTAAATKGRIFVMGGSNICGEALGVVECYDPALGQWKQLPDMRQARYGCAAASQKGRVYVFGGHGHWENLSDAECYDMETERWYHLQPMSAPRNHCGAAAAGNRIYVFGGHTNGQDIMTIDCLDPETGCWEVVSQMHPRSHCMTATVRP